MLRDLLDRLPDQTLPDPVVEFARLKAPPKKERYGLLRPIPDFPIGR